MPLTAAYDWVDVIVGFDNFMGAARYGNALACQDGLLTKLITPIAAPVPQLYFKRHQKFFRDGQSICVVMVAPHSLDAFLAFTRRAGGEVVYNAATASDEDKKGLPPAYELAWNHTTLRAMRVDPTITYLQSLYPFPDHLALIEKMDGALPGRGAFRISNSCVSTATSPASACRWCASPPRSGSTRSSAPSRTMAARSSTRTATRWRRAA